MEQNWYTQQTMIWYINIVICLLTTPEKCPGKTEDRKRIFLFFIRNSKQYQRKVPSFGITWRIERPMFPIYSYQVWCYSIMRLSMALSLQFNAKIRAEMAWTSMKFMTFQRSSWQSGELLRTPSLWVALLRTYEHFLEHYSTTKCQMLLIGGETNTARAY